MSFQERRRRDRSEARTMLALKYLPFVMLIGSWIFLALIAFAK